MSSKQKYLIKVLIIVGALFLNALMLHLIRPQGIVSRMTQFSQKGFCR
ncbi:hypothetical protein AB4254_11060 [Vibrio breoganii]